MNHKILVVDDEREIADLIEAYLQNENYTVYKFYSAKDALVCVKSTDIDLANRMDDARKSDSGGAELGLSIAREIVHLHGGKISVRSENNTVVFTVSLPVAS